LVRLFLPTDGGEKYMAMIIKPLFTLVNMLNARHYPM
jgi:hypothetical protein